MREEAKRDTAPPGWFGGCWRARIEHVMDFCCGVLFCFYGGGGLLLFGASMLDFHFQDAGDLLTRLAGFAISAVFLLIGLCFFREWRRDRAAR
jgi:hypothetical protein